MMTTIADLWLSSSSEAWKNVGCQVGNVQQGDGSSVPFVWIAGLGLRFVDPASEASGESSVVGWTLVTDVALTSMDGVPTKVVDAPHPKPEWENSLEVLSIDHIVITTGSLDRTCGEIAESMHLPLKRIREAGHGMRQGFHRAGPIILEILERPDLARETSAAIWGLVFVVADLDATVSWLGPDAVSEPRPAVQPGRRIASVKKEVGLGLPVALMSPHVRQ
ncbi:MAG: hypothetical protein WCG40_03970 [Actinomycetes bacterium]